MNNLSSVTSVRVNFRWYLSLAASWALSQERLILEKGIRLSSTQLADARLAGVAQPERVRLLCVEEIPLPDHAELRAMAEAMELTTPAATGLALRYGICVRSEYWGQRWLTVHKLAHTAQYERLGGLRIFIECYLYQCLAVGNSAAPLEQEAINVANRICGQPHSLSGRIPQ